MSDMRSMLSGSAAAELAQRTIKTPKNSTASPLKTKPKKKRRTKALPSVLRSVPGEEGLPLYSSTAIFGKNGLARKRDKRVRWTQRVLESSARKDSLAIKHWCKYTNVADYRFARFNKELVMKTYTDEEYAKALSSDASWTREDTDLLMRLVKQFDRRFIIVADRFGASKTVEDLKARYFHIQDTLARIRSATPLPTPTTPTYDSVYEAHRKQQLEMLFQRSKESETNTARLVLENRRIEQALRKLKKENAETKRIVKLQQQVVTLSNSIVDGMTKRSKSKTASPVLLPEVKDGLLAGLPEQVVVANATKHRHPGCYLRHTQLVAPLTVNQRLLKQLDQELAQCNLAAADFTVASSVTCEMWDRLRQDYVTMFNLQKLVLRKEADAQALRTESEAAMARQKKHAAAISKRASILPHSMVSKKAAVVSSTPQKKAAPVPSATTPATATTPSADKKQVAPVVISLKKRPLTPATDSAVESQSPPNKKTKKKDDEE